MGGNASLWCDISDRCVNCFARKTASLSKLWITTDRRSGERRQHMAQSRACDNRRREQINAVAVLKVLITKHTTILASTWIISVDTEKTDNELLLIKLISGAWREGREREKVCLSLVQIIRCLSVAIVIKQKRFAHSRPISTSACSNFFLGFFHLSSTPSAGCFWVRIAQQSEMEEERRINESTERVNEWNKSSKAFQF